LAVLGSNALFSRYGGLSFAGRYGWTAAVLLLVPTVDLLADLWAKRRALVLSVLAAELALQAVDFVHYAIDHYVLYSPSASAARTPAAWAKGYPTLWGSPGQWLPSYGNTAWVWHYLPDVLAPFVVVFLVLALLPSRQASPGAQQRGQHHLHRRARFRVRSPLSWTARGAFALSLVGYLLAVRFAPVPRPPITLAAGSLPHTGQVEAGGVVVSAPPDPLGIVTFGPPYFLTAGRYTAVITAAVTASTTTGASATAKTSPATWDVLIDPGNLASVAEPPHTVIAQGPIPVSQGEPETVTVHFTLSHAAATWAVQVRTRLVRPATIDVSTITLRAG
jgi:hypothetical protein